MDQNRVLERKAYQLGVWPSPPITASILDNIKSQIQNDKGSKIKLQLSFDGLRVIKSSVIQGKMLAEYIPMPRLQFFSIMKNSPDILFVVSLSGRPTDEMRYQINVFRMTSAMDTGLFATQFKYMTGIKKNNIKIVKQTTAAIPRDDAINWTLRSKEHDNSKRELRQMVDISGGKTVVTQVQADIPQTETKIIENGYGEVFENGSRAPMYRKGKPTRIERGSFESDFSDNRSEVSESALRIELESLSQELRDIKIMLEKSTGITTGSEPNSPRDFEPVNIKVHSHTVRPEPTVTYTTVNTEDNIDAVVLESAERRAPTMNGYTVANGDVTHVRVSVPDYRASTENVSSSYVIQPPPTVHRSYETMEVKTKPNTTSYENWKRNTLERNAVRKFHDFPERVQWRSRSNKPGHYVSARPRSAIVTSSTDAVDHSHMVEVRHHPAGVGQTYHRVSFNPRVVKVQDRKTQSLRSRGLSSTVVRPIEQVYHGRKDAKHHSLALRPHSAVVRPSILVKDEPVYVEQNNNVIKTAEFDDTLLDVSGLDLYRETPIEGAVIRT